MRRAAVTGAVLMLAASSAVGAASLPPEVAARLAKASGFAPPELAALEQGTVIARVADGAGPGEVLVTAAVKIKATRDRTLAYYGQMIAYVDGQVTLGFGKFGNPPAAADVQALSLDPDEIKALKGCRPGQCDLKLGGKGLTQLRATIDWNAADAGARANAAVRQATLDYVASYMKSGDEALVTYNDRDQPTSLKEQWRGLIRNSRYFEEDAPELREYLERYPAQSLAGARDLLYWVKENYGMKPVISLVHGVIYEPPSRPGHTLVFQKQIYASHYYDASAALAVVVEASAGEQPVTYILYANRSRGDLLRGGFGGLKRKVARDQALKAAKETLGTIKRVLEQSPG